MSVFRQLFGSGHENDRLLTPAEIEELVARLAQVIEAPATLLPLYGRSDGFARPHVEVVDAQYHFIIEENGKELERRSTAEVDRLLYYIFDSITAQMAAIHAGSYTSPSHDFEKIKFEQQLFLLEKLNPSWGITKRKDRDDPLDGYADDETLS